MTFSSYGFPTAKGSYPVLSQVKVFVQGPGPHLWFNLLSGAGCGEVDAATRMPAAIFEPSNQAALDAYIRVTLRDYGSRFALKVGRCVDRGYTDYSRTATSTSFLDRFPRTFQLRATLHTPWYTFYLVPMLIGG